MQWNWLISPLAGGVIGYGTNYLAIKMLFRPHNTKYIGKIKIPFTPGLVPKEKDTLARKIGEIIEEHLLNEDVLIETLTGPKAKDTFFKFINAVPQHMEKSDQTINEVVQHILGADIKQSMGIVIDQFVLEIITMLRSKEVMDVAIPYITNTATDMANKYVSNAVSNSSMVEYIRQFSKDILETEKTKKYIYSTLEDLEEKIYVVVQENASHIGKSIIRAIAEGQEAERIKTTIQQWINENFNPMVSMFIKVDKIYEGMIRFAYEALDDKDQSNKFGQLLCSVIKDLLHQQSSFLFQDDEDIINYKNTVINIIQDEINEANISVFIEIIREELNKKEEDTKTHIKQWIYDEWDGYLNTEEVFKLSKKVLEELVRFIGDTSLENLSMIIPEETKKQIEEKMFCHYIQIITKNSKTIADVMDISNLVESKINEFSSQEAEEVILSVVKNQLRGITWIGGLLGFIIGIIPNLIR